MFAGGIGAQELLLIFLIILLLFGSKRLPEFGRSLGQGIRQFRQAAKGLQDDLDEAGREEKTQKKIEKKPEGDDPTCTPGGGGRV
jgi:sec-independent protein translocase protein TatA